MKRIYTLATIAALLLCSAVASAQSFRSGYFLDNYLFGYRINPAQINRKSFISIATGSIDLQNSSNIGVASMLFPTENGMVTGLNSAVSAEDFLGGLPQSTIFAMDESINLLSSGTVRKNRMTTFEINLRARNTIALPRDLFAFLKQGGNQAYDISGLNLSAGVIGDASYGFAFRLSPRVSIGARAHFLLDIADVRAYTENSSITMGDTQTKLESNLHLQTSGIIGLGTDENGNLDMSKFTYKNPPFSSYGGGLDLGIEFKGSQGFRFFAAVTDLGAMAVKNTTDLVANSSITYTGVDVKYEEGTVKADYDAALEKLKEAIIFTDAQSGDRLEILPYNLSAGLRLSLFNTLSFGALATYHKDAINPWYELRAGAGLNLGYFINAAANVGMGTYGPSLGAAVTMNFLGFNIIAGLDAFRGEVGTLSGLPVTLPVPVPLPLHAFNLNAHVGVALNIGKVYKEEPVKKVKETKATKTESAAAKKAEAASKKLEEMKIQDSKKKAEQKKIQEEKKMQKEMKEHEQLKKQEEERKRQELKEMQKQKEEELKKQEESVYVIPEFVEPVTPSEPAAEPAKPAEPSSESTPEGGNQ
jgi:hypothetical protein